MIMTIMTMQLLTLLSSLSVANPYLLFANRPFVRRMNLDGSEPVDLYHNNDSSTLGLDLDVR